MSKCSSINYAYAPLSDESVVKTLIEYRTKLDPMRDQSPGSLIGAVTDAPMMEDVLILYIDLDRLIALSDLSPCELFVVGMLMQGYSVADISENFGKTRQAYGVYYRRAVKKIVEEYKRQWAIWHGDVKAKDHPRYCV